MATVRKWTGRESRALREAFGMSPREFATRIGVTDRSILRWEASGEEIISRADKHATLDKILERAPEDARDRFRQFLMAETETAETETSARHGDLYDIALPYMDQRGMSLRALAKAAFYDPSTVSNALRGKKPCGPALARRIDDVVGADGEFVKAAARMDSQRRLAAQSAEFNNNRALPNSDAIDDDGTEDIARLMAWINGSNTTSDAIEQIERAALYLSEAHSTVSPQVVLSGVLQTHGQVRTYLQSGKQRLRQTRELLRIDSCLLSHACLLLGDLGHHQKASEYGVAALVLAQEADADESSAWSARAKTARWQERYVESAELARRGFDAVALSPTKVELAYREANAIALFGDTGRARRALHSAQVAAEALPRDPGSSVWSFPVARQAIFAQSVAIHTGDPDGALYAAEMAEAAWANGEPKVPATCAQIQTGASIAHLMKDSLDGAADNIAPVLNLPYELRISTVIGYVRRLRTMLVQSRFAESGSAIELAEQIDDFISASSLGKD
jgi:transcriptional regulator with XRE-family HTH domain/lambda repressor-like predicted transcriptional regulator